MLCRCERQGLYLGAGSAAVLGVSPASPLLASPRTIPPLAHPMRTGSSHERECPLPPPSYLSLFLWTDFEAAGAESCSIFENGDHGVLAMQEGASIHMTKSMVSYNQGAALAIDQGATAKVRVCGRRLVAFVRGRLVHEFVIGGGFKKMTE